MASTLRRAIARQEFIRRTGQAKESATVGNTTRLPRLFFFLCAASQESRMPTLLEPVRTRYSASAIARRYQVGLAKVLDWIGTGVLPAINVASTSSTLPRWSISGAE